MCLVVALFCGNYQLCPLMKSTVTIQHAFNMVLEVHGMASVRLQPPPPFDFRNPDEWLCWKWRFEQFCQVSSLTAIGQYPAGQHVTLLHG